VYVNYGRKKDFDELISAGIGLKGTIAVARYVPCSQWVDSPLALFVYFKGMAEFSVASRSRQPKKQDVLAS
jgi:hypothetical protein